MTLHATFQSYFLVQVQLRIVLRHRTDALRTLISTRLGVKTHDLQIMTVHCFHVTEIPALTTRPSVTSLVCYEME